VGQTLLLRRFTQLSTTKPYLTIEIRFEGRFCTTNALVLPEDSEVLLGAIPMEEMDLWLNPTRQMLTFAHPEGPVMMLK